MNGPAVNSRAPGRVADVIGNIVILTRVALDRLGKAPLRSVQSFVDAGYKEHPSSGSRTTWPHLPR